MSRTMKFAAFAVACLALAAAPAYAAKGGGGGNTATIRFASTGFAAAAATSGTSAGVSFAVTANVKAADVPNLWVANICTDKGVTVSAEYHQVRDWVAGPFATNGSACTAYVWVFPDAWTALKGGSMTYSVTG